mmetsp:Transcript_44836/g.80672  ORF Transcript_44836/g.80672 Transcript_44836/m.80672 type:complete len:323 (-) Transcript_44836:420-1388(-)
MAVALSMTTLMDASETITIKNTFLDDLVVPMATAPTRRCSSVPRSWMPGEFCTGSNCGKSEEGEDSTTASDKEMYTSSSDVDSLAEFEKEDSPRCGTPSTNTDFEYLECDADSSVNGSGSDALPKETPTSKPVVAVKLLDFVGDAPPVNSAAPVTRTRLRAAARPFASVRALPTGIQMLMQAAKSALECDPSVGSVQIFEGAMGRTCTMTVHTAGAHCQHPRCYLTVAKNALLTSAERLRDTYILGYDVKPFTKIDKCSFSATLATIPYEQEKTACWDSYKNGHCPRRIRCRWTHPSEGQVMRLVIRVQQDSAEVREAHQEE